MLPQLAPRFEWWMVSLAAVLGILSVLSLLAVFRRRNRFPPLLYGGRPVPARYQRRFWRWILGGAFGFAMIGFGSCAVQHTKSWISDDRRWTGASHRTVLYEWSGEAKETGDGRYAVTVTERVLVPWLLLVAFVFFWWEVVRWDRKTSISDLDPT